jgi:hypothetical protein
VSAMSRQHQERTQGVASHDAPIGAGRTEDGSLQEQYGRQSLAELGRRYGEALHRVAAPADPVQQSHAEIDRRYAGASPPKVSSDWGEPRLGDFHGVALTRPRGEVQVLLGHMHQQAYWIANAERAPAGTTYRWRHTVRGHAAIGEEVISGETAEGASHELHVVPKVPGTKKIASTALQSEPGGKRSLEVDEVVLTTPVPKLHGVVLDSIGPQGNRRPVLDTLELGEDLLVTVRFELLDDDAEVRARLDSSTLSYKGARKVGPGELELRLHPVGPGPATGTLRVLPMETSSRDVRPIELEVTVEDLGNEDEAGDRPRDVSRMSEWLAPLVDTLFVRRRDGVENVYKQAQEKDPPPTAPLWKEILKTAVTIALNAVSAGLGAKIAGILISGSDGKPFTTELVKVLFEQTMATTALAAAETIIERSGPGATASKQGGPRRSLGITFCDAQKAALAAESLVVRQRHLATVENRVRRLEAEKPGSGFREGLGLGTALKKSLELAEPTQYIETFQRWCAVLAANSLNTEHDGPETNLGRSVDINKVVGMQPPGLSKTPGVLNLALAEDEQKTFSRGGISTHPVKIKSATLSGLGSQDFRSTIKDTPIRALQIPIVASFSWSLRWNRVPVLGDPHSGGFVIGRNEANQYWASEDHGYLSVLAAIRMREDGKADPRKAAEHIIMEEIGRETVEPTAG